MRRAPKRRRYTTDEGLQSQREAQEHARAEGPEAEEEDTSSSSSSCSSSSSSSSCSCSCSCSSSSSSSSCCYFSISNIIKALSAAAGKSSPLQSPERVCVSPSVMMVTPSIESHQGSSSQKEEEPSTSQALSDPRPLLKDAIDDKVANLVNFLLLKYRKKETTTKVEMLSSVIKEYQNHFPKILSQASECLQLVFGIDVEEVDPHNHSYVLVNTLGLTYNGMLSDEQSIPKAGLLINILGVIFTDGNCSSEEHIWEVLRVMGVYDGEEHFIYGEPRELITKVWVQEQYLEYRRVPNSDPARYEFLWGPRAHAETSKMKVLEILAKINNTTPNAFPVCYKEALRDEEVRSQARVVVKFNEWLGPGPILGPHPATYLK
ncbi:melanoma-associated antigen 10-like [Rousettus aegyptiacus]|uniref:melanoma-associated antigen 10-like n=1 Tax=Rousettus aegyptiacus TaxID=9407 RepID=UPI00168CF3D8|nr:melanoma-associated antigen 10-like [Rousettus aegyptiacus]